MIDYGHLRTLPSLSRLRRNPRQWDFFCWLLNLTDEKGWALVSVRQYADEQKIHQSTVQSWLNSVNFRSIVEAIKYGKLTLVKFLEYESYVKDFGQSSVNSRSKFGQTSVNAPSIDRNLEEKFPPAPPIKEENVIPEVVILQKKEKKAAGATIFLSGSFEERRERFWIDCKRCWNLHREWPEEGVRSFFLFWTEPTLDGQLMKFELEKTFGIRMRMERYIIQGHWLTTMAKAKLDAVRNRGGGKPKTPTTADIRRKEAALEAEKKEHDRQSLANTASTLNCTNHTDALLDPQYWLACNVDDPFTRLQAQQDPRHLEAFNKACEIAKKKT